MNAKAKTTTLYTHALAWAVGMYALALAGHYFWQRWREAAAPSWERLLMTAAPMQIVVLCTLLVYFLLRKPDGMSWNDCLVWRTKSSWNWPAFFGYWVMMLISALFAANATAAFYKIHWHEDITPQPALELLKSMANSPWMIAACLVLVAILAPLTEELFFRLTLFQCFNQRFSAVFSAIFTAFIFAAVHLHGPSFLPIFVISLYCQYLRHVFGLSASILAHALFNTLQFTLLLNGGLDV